MLKIKTIKNSSFCIVLVLGSPLAIVVGEIWKQTLFQWSHNFFHASLTPVKLNNSKCQITIQLAYLSKYLNISSRHQVTMNCTAILKITSINNAWHIVDTKLIDFVFIHQMKWWQVWALMWWLLGNAFSGRYLSRMHAILLYEMFP